jgi:Cd2+/Zn2+-exporting ATPase
MNKNRRYEFKIIGMDCTEEVSVLKHALAKYTSNEQDLGFDLLNGKLTIDTNHAAVQESELILVIRKTGLQAIPWKTYMIESQSSRGGWAAHNRLIMTLLSAVCILSGYFFHAMDHGFIEALTGKGGGRLIFPVISMVFYFLSVLTGGWFIFPKALAAAKRFRPDMNLLMTIAVVGAMSIGQWFEAATVAFLFSLALLLETWSVTRARQAIRSLLELAPRTARVKCSTDGKIEEKSVKTIKKGEVIVIRPGEKVPLDGLIVKGQTHINQAPITGESMPTPKQKDDEVYAGTINEEGSIEVRVTKAPNETTLSRIIHRIEEAQAHRAHTEQWVDTFARYYTPLMILLAISIALVPPLFFHQLWLRWFYEGLVILVIACPCALVISTPVSIVAGLSSAARNGILVKGGIYLELPSKLRAIAFDKTGTLTQGKPEVQQIIPLNGHTEKRLLNIAAALEFNSEHPIAHAICKRAEKEGLNILPAESFKAIKGKGAEGYVADNLYWIGSNRLLLEKLNGKDIDLANEKSMELEDSGHTIVIVGRNNHVCGLIGVGDTIREEASRAIQQLKLMGVKKLFMLTGDNEGTAKAIACAIGIDAFKSELLPEDKINHIKLLKNEYKNIAMIGDGINDAPAMATASLGVAMGAIGSDVAIETADVALMTDDLTKIAWLIQHSRRTLKVIKQNIAFSLLVKALFLTLAITGIATLWMAIAADMGASLIVIFNGLRLLKKK